jgi:hypothetical protein
MKSDTSTMKSFEIKSLIDRKTTARREMKYLVRWKDYELEHDEYWNLNGLQNALKLIQKYENTIQSRTFLSSRITRAFSTKNITRNSISSTTRNHSSSTRQLLQSILTISAHNDQQEQENHENVISSFKRRTYVTKSLRFFFLSLAIASFMYTHYS